VVAESSTLFFLKEEAALLPTSLLYLTVTNIRPAIFPFSSVVEGVGAFWTMETTRVCCESFTQTYSGYAPAMTAFPSQVFSSPPISSSKEAGVDPYFFFVHAYV